MCILYTVVITSNCMTKVNSIGITYWYTVCLWKLAAKTDMYVHVHVLKSACNAVVFKKIFEIAPFFLSYHILSFLFWPFYLYLKAFKFLC